jgi:hypothetical protein
MDLDLIEERAKRRGYKTVRTDWNERGDRGYLKVWAKGVVRTFTASGLVWPEGLDNAELLGERMTWARLCDEGFPGWDCDHGVILDEILNFNRGMFYVKVQRQDDGRAQWGMLTWGPSVQVWQEPLSEAVFEDWQAYLDLSCALAEVRS